MSLSGLTVALSAALAWSCASGGVTDPEQPGSDAGVASDAPVADDQSSVPVGDDDVDSGSVTDDDSGFISGDDDSGTVPGDDDDAGPVAGDDDAGATNDAGPPPVPDAGHDAGKPDAGCGGVAVVVNEIQTASAASASDEWIEIYNPSASCALDISGWSLKYLAVTGTSKSSLWTAASGTQLAAQGYAVIAGSGYTGTAPALGTFTNGLAAAGGGVGLYDATSTLLDSVGYGSGATNAFIEGTPAAAPAAGKSIARTPNGTDTNANATDFAVANTPTPGAKN